MLSPSLSLTCGYPAGRKGCKPVQYLFSGLALNKPPSRSCEDDPWNLNAQARLQSEGTRLVFKQLERSCRRWQLYDLQLYLRGNLRLGMHLRFRDRTETFTDQTFAPPEAAAAAGDGVIKAPMVGQVVRVNAEPGAAVAKGDVLVVIEAMKMENQIVAPFDGDVESVSVSVGDQVDANQLLLKLAAREEA